MTAAERIQEKIQKLRALREKAIGDFVADVQYEAAIEAALPALLDVAEAAERNERSWTEENVRLLRAALQRLGEPDA